MKFGYKEIKEFAENHEDERVRIIYRRLCEVRSKSAKWCDETVKLKLENTELKQQLQESGDSDTWREAYGRLESEITKLREENKQLRLGWCRESEKRQGEWHSEPAKMPVKIDTITIRNTLCYYCNGTGHIEARITWDSKTPYSQQALVVCRMCEGKGCLS